VGPASRVLILTNELDTTVDLVLGELVSFGAEGVRWNTETFPTASSLAMDPFESLAVTTDSGRHFNLGDRFAVYVRRPEAARYRDEIQIESNYERFARAESTAAIAEVFDLLREHADRWIGDPKVTKAAEGKLTQIRVAASVGFEAPRTLLCNSPEAASDFIAKSDGPVVAKTIRSPLVDMNNGLLAYTHVVTNEDLNLLQDLNLAPAIFQTYVEKSFEVRVTCVGDTFVPVAIYSQAVADARFDWRRVNYTDLQHELIEMPLEIANRCEAYLRRFGLNFGAFDFIVEPSGRWIFLECNPNGEWAWMQAVSGYPIGRRIAELLVTGH
jgi:glutathione synthase/RimK-type ligase-like ATP-grasp enzyme